MYDVIIVGGGPAGMSAALNLLRANKKVLILEKENFGGQIANSPRVENIPGIASISGSEFSDNLFSQITDLGAEFELEEVLKIEKTETGFLIITNYKTYESKYVILANGVTHIHLNIPNSEKYDGKGISYCAVCDGAFYKDKDVIVIGDANTALQYSLSLSQICKKVTICTLFDKFFGDQILIDRIKQTANISFIHNLNSVEFVGDDEKLTGVKFENTQSKENITINCEGCFIAIGLKSNNKAFESLVDLSEKGYIVVNENFETKTPGLYAIGDCTNKKYRQVSTAVSDAMIAALEIINKSN